MKLTVSAVLGFVLLTVMNVSPSFGQAPKNEPTKREIEDAYRSKSGEGGTFMPRARWEKWRIKEIRGWSLSFKRVGEKRGIGILTRQYRAVARKNASCSEYQITDTMPLPPVNIQIRPILVVDPDGVKACR